MDAPARPHGGRQAGVCLAALLALGLTLPARSAAASAPPPALTCRLAAPTTQAAGQPLALQFEVHNAGTANLHVLTWGTPFEGWFSAFVSVQRDGAALAYGGPVLKRGDPGREDYLRFPAGGQRSARVDLGEVFDLGQPGRYRVSPRIVLHDVVAGNVALPRPRDRHRPVELACNTVEFELTAPR